MLGIVVRKRQPEMEEKRLNLIKKKAKYTKDLEQNENEILRLLSAEGDILESTELIDTLEHSKSTSGEISKAIELGKETEEEIDQVRQPYKDYAGKARGFSLGLGAVCERPMYQFSLQWFQQLAEVRIGSAPFDLSQPARLENLISHLTYGR